MSASSSPCDSSLMHEIPLPDLLERRPEPSQENFQGGRLTSLVYIMRGVSRYTQTIDGGSWSCIPSRAGYQRRSTRELVERCCLRPGPGPAGRVALRWCCLPPDGIVRPETPPAPYMIGMSAGRGAEVSLPNVQPGDRPPDEHPLDFRRALEDSEDPGGRDSFRSSAACRLPWYQHGFSTPRPR
jgi:hypothetical protein